MDEFFDLEPGRYIGKNYRVIDYLGHGWEGEVYQVEEKETGVMRVAKLFYQNRHHEKLRHITYARKLYRLKSCPIIIQYHHKDSSYIKGRRVDFLVSDYIEGEVLSQHISKQRSRKLSLFEALHIFYILVRGLEHIHYLGEYHGDIHTDNIMIYRKGLGFEVRLIDILHLGRSTKDRKKDDIIDLIYVLHEMIGGNKYYNKCPSNIKKIILGKKKTLIRNNFKSIDRLRIYMDNLVWD